MLVKECLVARRLFLPLLVWRLAPLPGYEYLELVRPLCEDAVAVVAVWAAASVALALAERREEHVQQQQHKSQEATPGPVAAAQWQWRPPETFVALHGRIL